MFFDMHGSKEMAGEKRKKMDMLKQINFKHHNRTLIHIIIISYGHIT